MKVKFKNYTYYKPVVPFTDDYEIDAVKNPEANINGIPVKDYEYDEKHFNDLVNSRRYDEAVEYASQFIPNDVAKQEDFLLGLVMLKKEGYRVNAFYSRIPNDTDKEKVEFYENVFKAGGTDNITDNKYVDGFRKVKDNFFTIPGSLTEDPVHLDAVRVNFPAKKRSFLGMDFMAKDLEEEPIDSFYKYTGYNDAYLRAKGIQVIRRGDEVKLLVDKNNEISNEILYQLADFAISNGLSDANPTLDMMKKRNDGSYIVPSQLVQGQDVESLGELYNYITDAKQVKDNVEASFDKDFVYTSIIAPYDNDAIRALREAYNSPNSKMSDSEFIREYKRLGGDMILDLLAASGTANQEMWSNYYNDDWTDETIEPLDQKQKSAIVQYMGANKANTTEHYMFMNGKLGTLVTIEPRSKVANDLNMDNDDPKSQLKTRRIHIFFPGVGQEKAQEAIQRNTSTKAAQELNDIVNYQYNYKLYDGSNIEYGGTDSEGNPRYIHKDDKNDNVEVVDKNKAYQIMQESMILEGATRSLKFAFMNYKGDMVADDLYDAKAKQIALKGADEIFPGIPIADFDGRVYNLRNPADIEAIFNHTIDEDNIHFATYEKLQKIYYLYDRIMAAKYKYR